MRNKATGDEHADGLLAWPHDDMLGGDLGEDTGVGQVIKQLFIGGGLRWRVIGEGARQVVETPASGLVEGVAWAGDLATISRPPSVKHDRCLTEQ